MDRNKEYASVEEIVAEHGGLVASTKGLMISLAAAVATVYAVYHFGLMGL